MAILTLLEKFWQTNGWDSPFKIDLWNNGHKRI